LSPETNGLQITRTVFAPDGIPAVLVGLSLRNASNQTQSFPLLLEATSELIAAYLVENHANFGPSSPAGPGQLRTDLYRTAFQRT
jgi:hypothetical protein